MSNDKKTKVAFSRVNANGQVHVTRRLKARNGEKPEDFFQRVNAAGYNGGRLEQAEAHWNSDFSEYHAGKDSKVCSMCRAKVDTGKDKGSDLHLIEVLKIGKSRSSKDGLVSVPVYISSGCHDKIRDLQPERLLLAVKAQMKTGESEAEQVSSVEDESATSKDSSKSTDPPEARDDEDGPKELAEKRSKRKRK